ncbi:sodium:solute symporter family transporter [Gimesia aquarii]|uniref:Sodium/glucose cotransporter n=1 Tax=Gimesia aquarii TaxID=2527964 RepID=A0A517VNZ7_9PLAN|nr:sodium/solute symporter [Gimesia aquarii]QDT94736.1 Sodium/glucose cotransporter [Gimesia aquarii]
MKSILFYFSLLVFLFLLTPLSAAESQSSLHPEPLTLNKGLHYIDWVIIAFYAVSTIFLGWYFSRRQNDTSEYFIGSGQMNPILIGVSLFATLLSTITYLSTPGEILGKGPVYLVKDLAMPFIFIIVGFVMLPVYMKQRVTSAYELLEEKLGLGIRLLGAIMFICLRLVWMSLLVYLTASAITTMLNVGEDWIPFIVLGTGSVAIIYTSLGGLRAVVITDVIQTILLFGGAWLVIATISYHLGGISWFPTEWDTNWDTQPFISFDPSTRITYVGTFLSVLIWYIATSCGDQVSVQRFMSTKDAKTARKSLAIQLIVSVVVSITLALVGFALLGYFKEFPNEIPAGIDLKKDADKFFPHFIAYHLPVGVSGCVVSAMFAAAMSSIDSGVNSITAVVMTDFLDRFGRTPKTEKGHVLTARFLALGIGAFVVLASSVMGEIPGNITAVTNKTANLLTTPIFCLFFFALFIPFARPMGVLIGAILGTTTAVLIAFSGPIFVPNFNSNDLDPISFQWIPTAAVTVNIASGSLVSYLIACAEKNRTRT